MNNALQLANVIPLHASEASSFLFEGNTFFDLYERLLQSAPDFIYTVNSNGFFSFVNSRSAELTGYNRNELVEMRYLDIVAPEYVETVRNFYLRQVVRGPEVSYLEFPIITKSGKRLWIGQKVVVAINSFTVGFQAIARDISDKKNGEQELLQLREERKTSEEHAQQYLTALTTSEQDLHSLLAQRQKIYSLISHDLRSPLTVIVGFCDLLIQNYNQLSKIEQFEYINFIKESGKNQLKFLNDVLDYAKLSSGQASMNMKWLNLYTVIHNAIIPMLGIAKTKEITLTTTVPVEVSVLGDERWLHQAFTNLIGNALKFTHTNGSVTISISSLCNEHCTIDISDTGIGIPSTALGKLFSTEERYSTSGTKGEQGNGVGLLLTYEILARHRGSISIDSEIGKGTVVHLTLRHAFQNNAAILLVDDDPVVRLLHTNYLSRIFPSYKIVQAADGIEALKQAESVLPSLIVTDYSMPNMNGIQLIQELKKNPATSDIPIIAATGDSSNANHEALILSGARAVVLKPLVNSEFQTIAEKIFHEQQKEAVAVNDR